MSPRKPPLASTNEGLTVSPSLDTVAQSAEVPSQRPAIDTRVAWLCVSTIALGVAGAFVAQALEALIALITNLAYYGQFSLLHRIPADAVPRLGLWSIFIPIGGALVIGVMARYGSKAIRGHGIPEAMEQVLTNESRIPARITFLKPLSSAIAIGTGGPFGAEGPIIATGAAIGSVWGQILSISTAERKTLLAAGAAAGMAAVFGTPVSAVLLAIELLLFEYRPRSMVPVALAAAAATGVRMMFEGMHPVFAMTQLTPPSGLALTSYVVLGGLMGLVSVAVTKIVYGVEDAFEKLPIHWMWWPAIGGAVVGIVGYFAPDTLGVGYYNISNMLSNQLSLGAIVFLVSMKFISWSIALGSGTSGGTLAPLFTIGGGIGAALGIIGTEFIPALGIDPRIAALVGMAAIFSGASRAMLASVVFAFETTLQPVGLLPLLGGCAAAYLISSLMMRNSIMTEKIARRGIRTPQEYVADFWGRILVRDIASSPVDTVQEEDQPSQLLSQFGQNASHQGFPVVNAAGHLTGLVTVRDLNQGVEKGAASVAEIMTVPVKYVYDDCTVRQAADHMVNHGIGRLPVVSREDPTQLIGIVTRSDLLSVVRNQIRETELQRPTLTIRRR